MHTALVLWMAAAQAGPDDVGLLVAGALPVALFAVAASWRVRRFQAMA